MFRIKNILSEFFENSSVDGLRYVFGHYKKHRLFWGFLLCAASSMAIYSIVNSVLIYRRFDVSTSVIYKKFDKMEYPAISICTENQFRRDKVGSNEFILSMISSIHSDGSHHSQETNNKTCYSPNGHIDINIQTLMKLKDSEIGELLSLAAPRSEDDILKCWWNNVEENCRGMFYNHIDNVGICYTFNINEKVVLAGKNEKGNFGSSYGYGLNITNYKHRTLTTSGPDTGLKLVLNTDQDNYCGIGRKWHGAGFRAYIHDSYETLNYYFDKSILIQPGFKTDVFISPIMFQRQTETLGRCASSADIKLSPIKGIYSKKFCLYQCVMKFIYDTCHCTLFVFSSYREKFAQIYNLPADKINVCTIAKITCANNAHLEFVKKNIANICPECKTPCIEAKYDYRVTSTSFPSTHCKNKTVEKFENKNLVMVSFAYESNNVMIVVEKQAYTLCDLFTYFGGILGLFLGISFASFGEIFHFIFYSVKHFWERKEMKKVKRLHRQSVILSLADIYDIDWKTRRRRSSLKPNNRVRPA